MPSKARRIWEVGTALQDFREENLRQILENEFDPSECQPLKPSSDSGPFLDLVSALASAALSARSSEHRHAHAVRICETKIRTDLSKGTLLACGTMRLDGTPRSTHFRIPAKFWPTAKIEWQKSLAHFETLTLSNLTVVKLQDPRLQKILTQGRGRNGNAELVRDAVDIAIEVDYEFPTYTNREKIKQVRSILKNEHPKEYSEFEGFNEITLRKTINKYLKDYY